MYVRSTPLNDTCEKWNTRAFSSKKKMKCTRKFALIYLGFTIANFVPQWPAKRIKEWAIEQKVKCNRNVADEGTQLKLHEWSRQWYLGVPPNQAHWEDSEAQTGVLTRTTGLTLVADVSSLSFSSLSQLAYWDLKWSYVMPSFRVTDAGSVFPCTEL